MAPSAAGRAARGSAHGVPWFHVRTISAVREGGSPRRVLSSAVPFSAGIPRRARARRLALPQWGREAYETAGSTVELIAGARSRQRTVSRADIALASSSKRWDSCEATLDAVTANLGRTAADLPRLVRDSGQP
jgi:hypothetical protein